MEYDVAIVGGGAAGFYCAAQLRSENDSIRIIILEKSRRTLDKVRISGGGRCNVTHACFDPKDLVEYYPRGKKELLGPFHHYAPGDVMGWFDDQGVELKIEEDGRVFPVSDKSESIISALENVALKGPTTLSLKSGIKGLNREGDCWTLSKEDNETIKAKYVVLCTGSNKGMWNLLKEHGIKLIDPVPSLFAIDTPHKGQHSLSGISVLRASVKIKDSKDVFTGPLLITHKGVSGPAVLKMSSFNAIEFYKGDYNSPVLMDWLPDLSEESLRELLETNKRKKFSSASFIPLPKRLTAYLLQKNEIPLERVIAELKRTVIDQVIAALKSDQIQMVGKSTHKEEFVTAGGVDLREVNFKNFSSRSLSNVYMAGEMLNIDAVTGGFNFQAAWTGAYLVAQDILKKHKD